MAVHLQGTDTSFH